MLLIPERPENGISRSCVTRRQVVGGYSKFDFKKMTSKCRVGEQVLPDKRPHPQSPTWSSPAAAAAWRGGGEYPGLRSVCLHKAQMAEAGEASRNLRFGCISPTLASLATPALASAAFDRPHPLGAVRRTCVRAAGGGGKEIGPR
jgi:hypothetical protein